MSHGNFESRKLASLLQDRDITVKVSNLKSTGYDPRMGIIPYGAYNPSNAKLVTAASGYPSNYEHYSNFEPKALAQSKPKLTGQSYILFDQRLESAKLSRSLGLARFRP